MSLKVSIILQYPDFAITVEPLLNLVFPIMFWEQSYLKKSVCHMSIPYFKIFKIFFRGKGDKING